MVKVTFTLDERTVATLRQAGARLGKPNSQIVRDAIRDYAERIGHRVCLALRKRGVLLRPLGPVVVMMPPLSLTEGEAVRMTGALHAAIAEVTGS